VSKGPDVFQFTVYNRDYGITHIFQKGVRFQYQLRFGNQRLVDGFSDLTAKPNSDFPDAPNFPVDARGDFVTQQIIDFSHVAYRVFSGGRFRG
jgi:hypothetical protein